MKVDVSKQEITMLITILSQVQVQLDNAEQLLILRRKLQDVIQKVPERTGKNNKG